MSLLGWAITFLVVALVAALFGFTGIAAGAMGIARILFGLFLLIFVVLLVLALLGCAPSTTVGAELTIGIKPVGMNGAFV